MKENATPTPPGDNDAPDPVLAALRQRLADYGAAPPPGAWAGIRQRLPVAPRPWWRRPRRLLPLLALLLGLVATTATVWRWRGVGGRPPAVATAKTGSDGPGRATTRTQPAATTANKPARPAPFRTTTSPIRHGLRQPDKAASRPAETAIARRLAASTTAANPLLSKPLANASRLAAGPSPAAPKKASAARPAAGSGLLTGLSSAKTAAQLTTRKPTRSPSSRLLPAGARQRPRVAAAAATDPRTVSRPATATPGQRTQKRLALRQNLAMHRLAGVFSRQRRATTQPPPGTTPALAAAAHAQPKSMALVGLASRGQGYTQPSPTPRPFRLPAAPTALLVSGIDTLGLGAAKLVLPLAPPLPTPLAERPDSLPPAVPVRRWALLALAGPTLSYRTLGATTPGNTVAPRPDFARLERPALGFGAQVQVRRVLSGRWALAVGLGYQEYATRLALQTATDTTTTSVHQRDTYRLLTLPVQLGYALGAPRGRFAKALLAGAEVGWYQGGRSTEGNGCGCQQTAYTATASPYRPRTLALSLGLDLRYRVGGPAGRWQWVVQPTGRYVLTPFTSATAAGFTVRQPFSIGLLTGFSWDIR